MSFIQHCHDKKRHHDLGGEGKTVFLPLLNMTAGFTLETKENSVFLGQGGIPRHTVSFLAEMQED